MRKLLLVFLPFLCLIIIGWRSGGPGLVAGKKVTGAPGDDGLCNLSGCHSNATGGSGSVVLTFSGAANEYVPGNVYSITVTITDATKLEGGLQILAVRTDNNASVGTFTPITNTHNVVLSGKTYFEHGPPKLMTAGVVQWTFNWTAPGTNVGNIKFYCGGLATDNNNTKTGDLVYSTNLEIAPQFVPAPVADFSASPLAFCEGGSTTFTDASTGQITSWSWSFGVGAIPPTATGTGPHIVNYPTSGSKTITLTTTGPGGSDVETKSNYITVHEPVIADFSVSVNQACVGTQINFQNTSAFGTTCSWDFGDGTIVVGDCFPAHTYTAAGSYLVTLTIVDANGCTDNVSQLINIYPLPSPSVSSSNGTLICFGTTTDLSVPFSNTVLGWYLDGVLIANSAGVNPITVGEGNFYAEVSDANSCTGLSDDISITFLPEQTANFTPNGILTACTNENIVLNAAPGFVSYQWILNGSPIANGTNDQWVALQSGIYTLEATDNNGCVSSQTDTLDLTLNISPQVYLPPSVSACGNVLLDAGNDGTTYLWSNGELTSSIIATNSGNYSVTVTGNNSCVTIDSSLVNISTSVSVFLGNDTTICGSIVLDAGSGFASYLWNDGTTDQTLSVIQSAQYWVSVTDQTGTCSAADTINIIINALPQYSIFSSSGSTICFDETDSLIVPDNFSSYQWSNGSTQNINLIDAGGIYTVTVTGTNGCATIQSVTIQELPELIVFLGNDTQFCNGQTYLLDAGNNFSIYQWSTGDAGQSITISVDGDYGVTVTDVNGCVASDEINIEVHPLPPVLAGLDREMCLGDTVHLHAGGALSFVWFPPNALDDPNSANPVCQANTTISYTVTGTDIHNCVNSDVVVVTVNPLPPVPSVSNNGGDGTAPDTLQCSLSGFVYQWFLDGDPINGANGQTYIANEAGDYHVEITDLNNCSSVSSVFTVEESIGVSNVGLPKMTIFPNPVMDQLHISFENMHGSLSIYVFNLLGQEFLIEQSFSSGMIVLNTTGLPPGIYFLEAKNIFGHTISRFVKN